MACPHYGHKLTEDERYFIDSEEHNNCTFCLVHDKGPMTQEEVAKYFGISKMRVCQIEKRALKTFTKKMKRIESSLY